MRLSRTDVVPVLAILAGGAVGVLTSASLVLSSRSDYVPVADQGVIVPDGQRIVYWSSDGRIEYRPKEDFERATQGYQNFRFIRAEFANMGSYEIRRRDIEVLSFAEPVTDVILRQGDVVFIPRSP